MTQLDGTGMKRLHREWRRRTDGRLALVLDGVGNPFNVGAIVRTAAAERVDHLYLGSATAPDHDKVNKTALGTARYLTWTEFDYLRVVRFPSNFIHMCQINAAHFAK